MAGLRTTAWPGSRSGRAVVARPAGRT